jgi:hypothetical protein
LNLHPKATLDDSRAGACLVCAARAEVGVHFRRTNERVTSSEGCKLGPSSIILFEKSLIFGVIIKLSEMRRLCTFQKRLGAVGKTSPKKVTKPEKSDI